MKTFQVPIIYRSPLISAIKKNRRDQDRMKKDFAPTALDFGGLEVFLARHFGFCYGVENAIDLSFRILDENPGKRIFLLSEMIHNPQVNLDLMERGVRFLQDTAGRQLIAFETLGPEDIVIIPAFGTTLAVEARLRSLGIPIERYNTTCPFVEKVWNRSQQISGKNYTVLIHGKPNHEETRATFSHAAASGPAMILQDMSEAVMVADFIMEKSSAQELLARLQGQYSGGFQPARDLVRIGLVNQTTMLASETEAMAEFLRQTMLRRYGQETVLAEGHFADTRDTLCYATNDNQTSVQRMLDTPADLALVVGGFNSSNTTHLVELCQERMPTYFIRDAEDLLNGASLRHFDILKKEVRQTSGWLPAGGPVPVRVLLTSGASCPDALVEGILDRLLQLVPTRFSLEEMILRWQPADPQASAH